jgi:hypothetical protein
MSAPLSNKQKSYLSQLSDRAFNRAAAVARGRGESPADDKDARDQYRHEEVTKACGKLGLRCCSQDDYKRVEAHFLNLLGEVGKAFNAHVDAETEPRRVVEAKIVGACEEFGFHLSYAEAICRSQNHGQGLCDVPVNRLWNIFYTVRNRGLGRRKKERMAA